MDGKKLLVIGGAVVGSVFLFGGLYYLIKKSGSDSSNEETFDLQALLQKASEEIGKLPKPKKGADYTYERADLVVMVKVLSRYASLTKKHNEEAAFQARIKCLRAEDEEGYLKTIELFQNKTAEDMKTSKMHCLREFGVMEMDYTLSFQKHANDPEMANQIATIKRELAAEIFPPNEQDDAADITKEEAQAIFEFTRSESTKIILSMQGEKDPAAIRGRFMVEMMKVDDLIFIKWGRTKEQVLKAFERHDVLPKKPQMPPMGGMPMGMGGGPPMGMGMGGGGPQMGMGAGAPMMMGNPSSGAPGNNYPTQGVMNN